MWEGIAWHAWQLLTVVVWMRVWLGGWARQGVRLVACCGPVMRQACSQMHAIRAASLPPATDGHMIMLKHVKPLSRSLSLRADRSPLALPPCCCNCTSLHSHTIMLKHVKPHCKLADPSPCCPSLPTMACSAGT